MHHEHHTHRPWRARDLLHIVCWFVLFSLLALGARAVLADGTVESLEALKARAARLQSELHEVEARIRAIEAAQGNPLTNLRELARAAPGRDLRRLQELPADRTAQAKHLQEQIRTAWEQATPRNPGGPDAPGQPLRAVQDLVFEAAERPSLGYRSGPEARTTIEGRVVTAQAGPHALDIRPTLYFADEPHGDTWAAQARRLRQRDPGPGDRIRVETGTYSVDNLRQVIDELGQPRAPGERPVLEVHIFAKDWR